MKKIWTHFQPNGRCLFLPYYKSDVADNLGTYATRYNDSLSYLFNTADDLSPFSTKWKEFRFSILQ